MQSANPRSVLGYYEPGHYAFLVVDGRTKESKGVTMQELSQLCETLGFARAYNLDGGRSSVLISTQGFVNEPLSRRADDPATLSRFGNCRRRNKQRLKITKNE